VNINLVRFHETDTCTLGVLTIGTVSCVTLEDPYQRDKVPGNTRIPAGSYSLDFRKVSPMASSYRERYGDDHEGMIWLQHVPGFRYVYIHVGNTVRDTQGCILVGKSLDIDKETIYDSRKAYKQIYPYIQQAIRDHDGKLVIQDHF